MRYWCYGVIVLMHVVIERWVAGLVRQKVGQKDGSKTYNCLYTVQRTESLRFGQITVPVRDEPVRVTSHPKFYDVPLPLATTV